MADFIFDGVNRKIRIDAENDYNIINGQRWYEFSVVELYSAWKRWVQAGEGAKFPPAFMVIGGQDIGGGIAVGSYIFMNTTEGWVGVPPDVDDIIVKIEGNLYPDVAGNPVMEKHPQFTSTLMLSLSNMTEVVTITSGSGLSQEQDAKLTNINMNTSDIPASVWEYLISSGYPAEDILKLVKNDIKGRAVISVDDLHTTIYDTDNVTVSHEFDISADKRTRTPV